MHADHCLDFDAVDVHYNDSTRKRVFGGIALLVLLTSCVGSNAENGQSPDEADFLLAPVDGDESAATLPTNEVAAIIALGETGSDRPPDDEHVHGHGGSHAETKLNAEEQASLDAEIDRARSVINEFDTVERAAARGYVLATSTSPGIGIHWVRWSQIREPFRPDNPSMLLFDHRATPPLLVGYSYAIQSAQEPDGFTGSSDKWHRHAGLCVALNGWVIRERASGPDACDGSYIAGGDFWMLHAWIVPGWENRDGLFAPANRKLCPANSGPDFLRCGD